MSSQCNHHHHQHDEEVDAAVREMIEDLQQGAAQAPPEPPQPQPVRERRHRLRNWQRFDKITIETKPRFKTSSLSGNEWRFNALIRFERKGKMIYSTYANNVEQAAENLREVLHSTELHAAVLDADVSAFCDQEGCSEPWTRTYTLKKEYCSDCARPRDSYDARPMVVHFCDRHSDRGDCGIEDCNDNYVMDVAQPVPARSEDTVVAQTIFLS